MKNFVIGFHVHQPYRVNEPGLQMTPQNLDQFFAGPNPGRAGLNMQNKFLFNRVAKNSYLPGTKYWLEQLQKYPNLKLVLSFSGTFLDQCLQFGPIGQRVIKAFQKLIQTGRVEILGETHYHSLVFFYSKEEYIYQINKHKQAILDIFNYEVKNFRNTEIIFNSDIASVAQSLGFAGTIASYSDRLNGADKQRLFKNSSGFKINIRDKFLGDMGFFLKRNLKLLLDHVNKTDAGTALIFYIDFEILGEHNEESKGAFTNMTKFIDELNNHEFHFQTLESLPEEGYIRTNHDFKDYSSWSADHSIISWRGNFYQETAFAKQIEVYDTYLNLLPRLKNNPHLPVLEDYLRKLTTSDHLYYLSKIEGDTGVFHEIFTPYNSPEEAFGTYLHVLHKFQKLLHSLV